MPIYLFYFANSCETLQSQNGLSHSKSGSDVKINDAIQVPRVYEDFYYSHNDASWREQSGLPCRTKNGMEEQGKEAELGFYGD